MPASWHDPEIMGRHIAFETSVRRAAIIQSSLVLARRHPHFPDFAARVIDQVLDHLEAVLEEEGLERPSFGWRTMVPVTARNPGPRRARE